MHEMSFPMIDINFRRQILKARRGVGINSSQHLLVKRESRECNSKIVLLRKVKKY